jgi:hypothetical protein
MVQGRLQRSNTSGDVATRALSASIDGTSRPCRFRRMQQLPRSTPRVISDSTYALILALTLACESSTPAAAKKDTAVAIVPPPESTVVAKPEPSAWDSTAGPALFIVGSSPAEALVIAPRSADSTMVDSAGFDLARVRAIQIDLFGGGKKLAAARVGATTGSTRSDSCRTWPTARLQLASGDTAAARGWTVGFEAGHATETVVDSIEGLATADSAQLAADIARIASALPGDTSATFRGLPFVVNKAWRAHVPGQPDVLVAVVVRNVNQEANPRQERILLIAERDSAATRTRYSSRYSERVVGPEETLESTDPIAIVLLGVDRRPTVVVTRDTGSGVSYSLIERVAGRWQRRWASVYAGC